MKGPSRRRILEGAGTLALGAAFAARAGAAARPPQAITPQLIEAAKKEAKGVLYSAMDLAVGEKLGKAFQTAYPGITIQIERSGSERLFQCIAQEFDSNIHAADVINSSDASHFISWKKKRLADAVRDGRGRGIFPRTVSRWCRHVCHLAPLFVIDCLQHQSGETTGCAEKLRRPARFPNGRARSKAHPAYSGTIMTATFQLVRKLGWEFFEKLARQRVMQVQSSTGPAKKLALGERAVMADGNDYGVVLLKEAGQPVEPVYPLQGTPTISGPTGIFAGAPHPNAAKLFQAWLHTRATQQLFVDFTAQYSVHARVTSKNGRRKISGIKLINEDPAGVKAMSEEIKTRYAKLFRV